MGVVIHPAPEETQHIQPVTLGGVEYRVRFTWSERNAAWYFDVLEQDGTPIYTGYRVSANWSPTVATLPVNKPGGEIRVRGFDGYSREDFGQAVEFIFYPESEIPTDTTSNDLIITVL